MYFLLVLIASTRRDASVILTPGTGDSVGTRGGVAAVLELIAAVPMPSSTTAYRSPFNTMMQDAMHVHAMCCRFCVGGVSGFCQH